MGEDGIDIGIITVAHRRLKKVPGAMEAVQKVIHTNTGVRDWNCYLDNVYIYIYI